MAGCCQVGLIMSTQYYAIYRLHYVIVASFLYFIFILYAHLAVNLLNGNSEGKLGWQFIGNLPSKKLDVTAVQEVCIFMAPAANLSLLKVTFNNCKSSHTTYFSQVF